MAGSIIFQYRTESVGIHNIDLKQEINEKGAWIGKTGEINRSRSVKLVK